MLPPRLAELLEKQAISEVLYRYCRATDRNDMVLLREVYWDDAVDEHGVFSGPAMKFVGFIGALMGETSNFKQTHHQIGNILIDLRGDDAQVESYSTSFHRI